MNSLKKLTALLLAVAMIFSMSTIVALADETDTTDTTDAIDTTVVESTTTDEEAADVLAVSAAAAELASLPGDDVTYGEDYRFDYALGLFELLPDGYWQTQQVKRDEFATVVAKMLKANTDGYPRYGQTPYSDVDVTSEEYPAICYLTDIGILNGDGDSTFRPDDPILVNEASKMIMCALGYQYACETSYGGFPNGYTTFALRQGVYDDLSLSYTNSMTALEMAKMVRNAMEAYMMESYTYNSDGSLDLVIRDGSDGRPTKTLLDETYKIYNDTGYVVSTYYSDLVGSEVDLENEVVLDVDGDLVTYQFSDDIDAESYLGYEVEYYYMEDVSGYRRDYISYMEPYGNRNNSYDVDIRNLESLTSTALEYTDDNDREKSFTINGDTYVSYNGKPYTLTDEELSLKQGHIKVVTHESSSLAKAVIIQEQFDGLFERYNKSTYQVIFQNSATLKQLGVPDVINDDSNHVRFTLDGETIDPADLQKDDAISVCVSKDGEYIRGYVSRDILEDATVNSSRTETYPSGDYQVVTIGGEDYFISAYCTKEITAGFNSDFQLTYDGKIIGTNASTSNSGNYGYLIDFADGGDPFSSTFMAKILDRYGNIKTFTSATKVNSNINGEEAKVEASEVVNSGIFDEPQLIVFELNSSDEIRTIYAATDNTSVLTDPSNLDFGKYFDGTATYSNSLIGTSAIDDSTLIFSVPYVDRDRDDDYAILTKDDMSTGSYTTEIYDIRNGVANVIVIKEKEPSKVSDTAKTLVVDEFSTVWDEDKAERVDAISGYNGSDYVTLMIDDDVISRADSYTTNKDGMLDDGTNADGTSVSISDLKRGDVIAYEVGSNGYLSRFRVLNNYTKRKAVTDSDQKYFEINQDGQESYKLSTGDDCYLTFGLIKQVYDYYFVETSHLSDKLYYRAYPTTDVSLYIYDLEKDEIRIGDPYDIEQDDDVFIRTKNVNDKIEIVVYQD